MKLCSVTGEPVVSNRTATIFLSIPLSLISYSPAGARSYYANCDYGFAASVPQGFPVEYDEPPAPNHGFLVRLDDGRTLGVFAYYDAAEADSGIAAAASL